MLVVTMSTRPGAKERPVAAVGCKRIAPEADYALHTRDADGAMLQFSLDGYPRLTEPALALVVRLLARMPAQHRPRIDEPVEYASASVYLQSGHQSARLLEHVVVQRHGNRIGTLLAGEFDWHEVDADARDTYPTPLDLLEHGTRVALWGSDSLPQFPVPLTAVPIKMSDGRAVVYEHDIPAFPRQLIAARMQGRTVPQPDSFFAWDWQYFIGAPR